MKKSIYSFIVILIGVVPTQIFAMGFFFETNHSIYGSKDTIVMDVLLDSEDVVNTISGELSVSGSQNISIDIVDGNSSILFWVDKPSVQNNKVVFSGITPGGIQGSSLFLFSLVITGQNPKETLNITMNNGRVLLHDGEGTNKNVSFIPKKIYISEDDSFTNESSVPFDKEQPEDFTPSVVQDLNLYDGKYTLVFATQDKLSGINRYEIKEGYFGTYSEGQSPYLLKDQKRFKTVFVKAIDDAGNERIAMVHPQEKIFDENFILIFSILIVLGVAIIIYRKKYR